jgi:hypothetical protein
MPASLLPTGERRRDDGERLFAERINGLGDGAEIVEDVLRPGSARDQRLAGRFGVALVGLDEVERVGDEAGVELRALRHSLRYRLLHQPIARAFRIEIKTWMIGIVPAAFLMLRLNAEILP